MHEKRIYQYLSVKKSVQHNLPLRPHTSQPSTLNHVHFCSGYLILTIWKPFLVVISESLRLSFMMTLTNDCYWELIDKNKDG